MSHVELYTQSEKEERKIKAQESAELEKDFEDYIKAMQKNSKKKRRTNPTNPNNFYFHRNQNSKHTDIRRNHLWRLKKTSTP